MRRLCLSAKAVLLVGLIFCCIPTAVKAQLNPPVGSSPWKYVNPYQHGFSFNAMSFIDDQYGIAVGNSGGIGRTTDSGYTWQYLPYKFVNPTNMVSLATFNDVQFVTSNIAYAVGNNGLMIKSSDAGTNWTEINTPLTKFNKNIYALHFLNKDTGYIGGQAIINGNTTDIDNAPKVYFTHDGGATWDSLSSPFRPAQNNPAVSGFNGVEILRIKFINDSLGYVSGSAAATPNKSAIVWKIKNNSIEDYSLHRTKFGVSTTTGAGSNPVHATQNYKGLVIINDSLILVSSNSNGIVVRIKTGKNDSTANAVPAIYGDYEKGKYEVVVQMNTFPSIPVDAPLTSGAMWHMKKTADGKIFLSNGNCIGFTTDNGTSWGSTNPIPPMTSAYGHWGYFAMDITPNGRIVVGGMNGLTFDSLPGSAGWRTQYKNIRPLLYSFLDIDWADCDNGVLVGSNGTIAKTVDGGETWTDNSNNAFDAGYVSLSKVKYPSVDNMIFAGGASMYRSPDQGTTNNAMFTIPYSNTTGISSFDMKGTDSIWAVGYMYSPNIERTMIFRTFNASSATPVWDTVKTFPLGNLAPQLRNIQFANKDTGYVTGSRGKVYRTINAGNTWEDISPDTLVNNNGTATYTGLSVLNGTTLYIGGSSKKLFKSTDAGLSWTDLTLVEPSNPSVISPFTSIGNIVMNDEQNGYIQAGNVLLKTQDGWQNWTYDLAPSGMQNISLYPKIEGPIESKKLFVMPMTFGFPGPISTQTASLLEYGDASLQNISVSETITDANCTAPNGGSIVVNATGAIAPYSYSLDGANFQSSNAFTGLANGTYTVYVKDEGCKLVSKEIQIGFTDNMTLTVSPVDTSVCAGAPVQLNAISTDASFSWTNAGTLSDANIANPVATPTNNSTYTVTASLGTCTRTANVSVTIQPSPIVNAGPDKTIVEGGSVQLNGSAGANTVSVNWTPAAGLVNAQTFTPLATPTATTTYTMTVTNTEGCTSTDDVTVEVIPYCVQVMNAFTPNGDGMNDQWLVTTGAACTKQIMVKVYNRYGGLVYSNDNYQNDWNGTYKGKPAPDGTYYYVIRYTLINGKIIPAQGNVTILR